MAPLVIAVVIGLATGIAPGATLAVMVLAISAVVLVPRLEWAALAVVGSAVFEDYLARIWPWTVEWLTAVLLVSWLLWRAGGRGVRRPRGLMPVLVPAGVFWLALSASFVASPLQADTVTSVLRYLMVLVSAVVLADCLTGPVSTVRAVRVFVGSCVVATGCGLVTAALAADHLVSGPIAGADAMALFLVAALPLVGGLGRGWQAHWVGWMTTGVLLVGLVGTRSLGALVAVAVVVPIAVIGGLLALRYAGILLMVIATGAAFVLSTIDQPLAESLDAPQRTAQTSLDRLTQPWGEAVTMTRERPILGAGPGSFAADPDRAESASSTALEASAELGIAGSTALAAVFVVPLVTGVRRWRRHRSRRLAGALLALLGALIVSIFVSAQYALPLWFLAALSAALAAPTREATGPGEAPADGGRRESSPDLGGGSVGSPRSEPDETRGASMSLRDLVMGLRRQRLLVVLVFITFAVATVLGVLLDAGVDAGGSRLRLVVSLGLVLAVGTATAAAVARERRVHTVDTALDVEEAVRAPLLAHLSPPFDLSVLPALSPGTAEAEAIEHLRRALENDALGGPRNRVVVAGVAPGEVSVWVGANLAISMAGAGHKVLLVDGRIGDDSGAAAGPATPGLGDVLRGADLQAAVRPGPVPGLSVLAGGSVGTEPVAELIEHGFAAAVEAALGVADHIVVLGPPLEDSDDSVLMSVSTAMVMTLVEGSVARSAVLAHAVRVRDAGGVMAGAVMIESQADRGPVGGGSTRAGAAP